MLMKHRENGAVVRHLFPDCSNCKRCFLPTRDDEGYIIPPLIREHFKNNSEFVPLHIVPKLILNIAI